MGCFGPILDLKLISSFCFLTDAIAGHMKLLELRKLEKLFFRNLSSQFAQGNIHITLKITRG